MIDSNHHLHTVSHASVWVGIVQWVLTTKSHQFVKENESFLLTTNAVCIMIATCTDSIGSSNYSSTSVYHNIYYPWTIQFNFQCVKCSKRNNGIFWQDFHQRPVCATVRWWDDGMIIFWNESKQASKQRNHFFTTTTTTTYCTNRSWSLFLPSFSAFRCHFFFIFKYNEYDAQLS